MLVGRLLLCLKSYLIYPVNKGYRIPKLMGIFFLCRLEKLTITDAVALQNL